MNFLRSFMAGAMLIAVMGSPVLAASSSLPAGQVQSALFTSSSTDAFTTSPSKATQSWLLNHFRRAVVYSPYWDSRLSWFPNAWAYIDSYALYTSGDSRPKNHPEWILRDANGAALYIPWGCSGGTCPQFAGDPGNEAFRQQWIQDARGVMGVGYSGIFIDDVNLQMRVGDNNGNDVTPIDPRTGKPMTSAAWAQYMADFLKEIRLAFPDKELVQNQIWYASSTPGSLDGPMTEAVDASDYIFLERGISDPGLTGGTGTFSVNAFEKFIDQVHQRNKNVIFGEYNFNGDYPIAGYLLTNNGKDLFVNASITTNNWPTLYNTNLGTPVSDRYQWSGVLRRDFTKGFVLLNPAGSKTVQLNLGSSYLNSSGKRVSSVTLKAGQGAVLQ